VNCPLPPVGAQCDQDECGDRASLGMGTVLKTGGVAERVLA
jgi:hypothetical protein